MKMRMIRASKNFYPRSPCGERPYQYLSQDFWRGYFYPRSPCGERLAVSPVLQLIPLISIHALLAESDAPPYNLMIHQPNFYPRSPCGERLLLFHAACFALPISIHALLAESDVSFMLYDTSSLIFLSTLSLRRATCVEEVSGDTWARDFYPRSPCGERRKPRRLKSRRMTFLSTLSLRRATGFWRITPEK